MPELAPIRPPDLAMSQSGPNYARGADNQLSAFPIDPQMAMSTAGDALNQHQLASRPSPSPNGTSLEGAQLPTSNLLDMHLRALRAKEKAWGADHPTTLDTAAALGSLYASQRSLVGADAEHGKL